MNMAIRNCELCGTKCKGCECCIEYTTSKDDLIEYKCLCCNKSYQKQFDGITEKTFADT